MCFGDADVLVSLFTCKVPAFWFYMIYSLDAKLFVQEFVPFGTLALRGYGACECFTQGG